VAATTLPKQYFSLVELRDMGLGSRERNQDRITSGELPAYMVGNRWKVHVDDLPLLTKPSEASNSPEAQDERLDWVFTAMRHLDNAHLRVLRAVLDQKLIQEPALVEA
jgi:hypothetical protein